MTKFAQYNENNEIVGFYSKDIHGDNIPENTISITDDKWEELLNNGSQNYRVDLTSNSIIPYVKPIQERIDLIKTNKLNIIKNSCKQKIESIYPQWKQNNIQGDSNYAQFAIQQLEKQNVENGGYDYNIEDIVLNATLKVGLINSILELKQFDVDAIDMNNMTNINIDEIKTQIYNYYKDIIKSIIAHRIIRIYRNYSNELENNLNVIYNDSNLTDEEKLNQIEGFYFDYDNV